MNPAGRAPTVLVIDDDAIIRLMATESLAEAGYEVAQAANAEDGCAWFEREGADLVLLDVILPGMNGFAACARLRTQAAGANVPIIVMTGLDDRASILGAYESGATDFITKPIVWDLLPYRVRYALRASAALREVARSQALLSRSQSLANMGSWEWSRASGAVLWSDEMHRIHGTAPDALRTPDLLALVHPGDLASVGQALAQARERGTPYAIEFRIVRHDGSERIVLEQTDVVREADGSVSAVRGIRQDITQRAQAQERIHALAFFDPLTGLANRALLLDMTRQWLSHGARNGSRCAVLVVDIDRFKLINETHGPSVGDEVLEAVGERLRVCLRAHDPKATTRGQPSEDRLARVGGDEFMVLVVDLDEPGRAGLVAQRIANAFVAPIVVRSHELLLSARIGISVSPDDGADAETLLRNASTAMHAAKQDAQQPIRFYDGAMSAAIQRKLTIETELRAAVDAGQLRMVYQAKVDLRDSRVVGAEALLRWAHPTRGLVAPLEFIPSAEESGLIVPITQWVLPEVCRQIARWHAAGLDGVPVSINVDAASLQGDGFVDSVAAALARCGLAASAIELEVTESSLMRDLDRAHRVLSQLHDLGVKISIDDFGTGYSSLTYLKRFPVDVLKIDRSFIRDLATDASDGALTSAIIAMGHSLDLQLVAEGVENWDQAGFLVERGCHVAQGYLFSIPSTSAEFAELLRSGRAQRGAVEAGRQTAPLAAQSRPNSKSAPMH